jgi:hypothetical protein
MHQLPKWEDLELEQQLLVLNWARDSIDAGMKQQIQARSYTAFVQALNGKRETFDMSQIWAELPETTRAHFDHASEILLGLEEAISAIEEDFEGVEEEEKKEPSFNPEVIEVEDRENERSQ